MGRRHLLLQAVVDQQTRERNGEKGEGDEEEITD